MAPKLANVQESVTALQESVLSLTESIEDLKTHFSKFTGCNFDGDDENVENEISLKDCIATLTTKVEALNYDIKLTEIDTSINEIKDTVLKNILEDNKKISDRLTIAEGKLKTAEEKIVKTEVNLETNNRLLKLEKTSNQNSQRSRENNLELHGVHNGIIDKNLETTIVDILGLVGVVVQDKDIQGCHRLPARRN